MTKHSMVSEGAGQGVVAIVSVEFNDTKEREDLILSLHLLRHLKN